jgi:tetratricopeptide (TPR) repeat protein
MTVRHSKSATKAKQEVSADLKKLVEEWVKKRFGIPGILALAIILALGAIWWKWDDVAKVPGISELVKLLSREKLPHADPDRFSIAVAHLDGDTNGDDEKLLVDGLERFVPTDPKSSLPDLKILRFDRTIQLKGGDTELAKSRGHQEARRLLTESGADVLLWGEALRAGSEARARLYWTANSGVAHGKPSDLYAVQFELPKVFWTDMTQWLGLLVESQVAEFAKLEGQYAVARLKPFIERSRKILNTQGWDPDTQAKVRIILAYALRVYGEQAGISQPLEEAIGDLKEVLKECTRDRVPLDWAATQNDLGMVLYRLGELEAGTTRLEEAVAAYQEALKERTRERVPLDWAQTQNDLGMALDRLGEREAGTARLEEAVAAYQEALKERTRERVPLDWATTQNDLGNTLWSLSLREAGTTKLEAALAAYQEALKERTRQRVPLDWAKTQNNLGNALQDLGQREADTAKLEAAVAAFQEALKEGTRERVPLYWALYQSNLGNALNSLGQLEAGTTKLEAAVAAYQEALKEYTRQRVPLDWARTQNNLGNALDSLGQREAGTTKLEAAVAAYQEALKERTRERAPLDWTRTQNALGMALDRLGEREADTAKLEAAITAHQNALQVWRGTNESDAKFAQDNLDHAQTALDKIQANQH